MKYECPYHVMGDTVETHINMSTDSKKASVYTNDRTVANKLFKLCEKENTPWEVHKVHRNLEGKCVGYTFTTDPKAISFREGIARPARVMTDEQKAASRERFLKMWEAKKAAQNKN